MKLIEIALPMLLSGLLLSPGIVHASEQIVVQPVINFDLQGLIDTMTKGNTLLHGGIAAIAPAIGEVLRNYFESSARDFDSPIVGLLKVLFSANPAVNGMKKLVDVTVTIISSLYLLFFTIAALMFLAAGISVEKKILAKEWMKNSLFMVAGVNVSFPVYGFLLEIGTAISAVMLESVPHNFFSESILAGSGLFTLLFIGMTMMFAAFTLFLRHVFLLVGAVLFPIGIVLYFLPPTRKWGRVVFNLIGAAIALQFVDAALIVASSQAASIVQGAGAETIMAGAAFVMIGTTNLAIMVFALAKSAFAQEEKQSPFSFAAQSLGRHMENLRAAIKESTHTNRN